MTLFERRVEDFYKEEGWLSLRSGWPDFLFYKENGPVFCVEAKQGKDQVRPNQEKVHTLLARAGLPTFVIRPENLGIKHPNDPSSYYSGRLSLSPEMTMVLDINHLKQVKEKLQKQIDELREDYELNSDYANNIYREIHKAAQLLTAVELVPETLKTDGLSMGV